MKFVIKHIENRSLLKISNTGHFKVFFLWILLLFSFLSSIAQNVTLSGAIITQSGGSLSSRGTPQDIIDAGYGTLTGAKTITMGNYHLIVNGFYEDTGWTYIFSSGRRMIAGSSCNWVSGKSTNGQYYDGAIFNIYSVSGSSDVNISQTDATLFWYGVIIDNKSLQSRLRMNPLNATSEVVLTLKNPSYLTNNVGDIALFELSHYTAFIRHGANVGRLDKFLHVSPISNSIYNNTYAQDIIYNLYQPISETGQSINFYSITGTRDLVLNNPILDTDKLWIYRNGEVIRINEDLEISVSSNSSQLNGIDIHVFTQDGSYQFPLSSVTDTDGEVTARLLDIWRGNGNEVSAYNIPSTIVDRRAVKIVFARYDINYKTTDYNDVIGNGVFPVTVFRAEDINISESDKTVVDSYTKIDNLDNLYDRAKSWKVDAANIEHPTLDSLLVLNDQKTLLLGNHDLVIDRNATAAFSVDKTNRIITIKADTLVIGDKFTSIQTTGTITTQNGATLEFGYTDDSGINKFVHLDWNENATQNVSVENLSTNTAIVGSVSATNVYKGHFLMPNPAPSAGIQVEIASIGGYTLFQKLFPEPDMNFIRTNITLNASEEKQIEMLFLAKKILQKSEGINEALTGNTPNIVNNSTVTATNAAATNENQEAILQLLLRVLNKVSSNREAFRE